MIICLCANVSEELLNQHLRNGGSLKDFIAQTDASKECGSCYEKIEESFRKRKIKEF